ncbi:DUF2252_family protein [Hexamita inflata]|uniref:DUF2252 family protein n=1 Tax=Hexamita inflata TaxID=28002 RepID=A0AA86QSP9_9EUKA|nr:DUF2252 family protein [Hexamita inflata]
MMIWQNIEFMNDFNIEVLSINFCPNIIPKLNNSNIKKIVLDNCGIQCLTDFQLPNLETLIVQESNFEDSHKLLQSLVQFKKLKELELKGYENLELNLIPLQLTEFCLNRCNLKNIEQLSQLPKLTQLILYGNQDVDITSLSQMFQLTELNVYECCLKNVDALGSLLNLKKLSISNNDGRYFFQDIDQIKSLLNLKELYLSNNQSLDINSLQHLVNLKELDLSFNSYINIQPLQYLKSLSTLKLYQCSIIDLTYLKPLINLKELDISVNNIVYLEPLKELQQIVSLSAYSNKIRYYSVLNNHPNSSSYKLCNQDQTTKIVIMFAKELRDINAQISSLKSMRLLRFNLKQKRNKIEQCLQRIIDDSTQFIQQVASFFQQLSTFQNSQ